jgi:hypothetical protein
MPDPTGKIYTVMRQKKTTLIDMQMYMNTEHDTGTQRIGCPVYQKAGYNISHLTNFCYKIPVPYKMPLTKET